MKRKLLTTTLALALSLTSVFADGNSEMVKGLKSPQKVMLDGKDVQISAYNIKDENYFKLRDIAALLSTTDKKFDVQYNKEKNMIEVTLSKSYQKMEGDLAPLADGEVEGVKSPQVLEVNAVKQDVRAYNIGGNNYFRLRDLGEKLGFGVDYDAAQNKVLIMTDGTMKEMPKKLKSVSEVTKVLETEGGWKVTKMQGHELAVSSDLSATEGITGIKNDAILNYMVFEKEELAKTFIEKEFNGKDIKAKVEVMKSGFGDAHIKMLMENSDIQVIREGKIIVMFIGVPEADVNALAKKFGL